MGGQKRKRTNEDLAPSASNDAGPGPVAAPPAKQQQQLELRRSLFLRSLAPNTTTQSLIEHFSQSYPIKHATAVVDPTTKQCKGYGFVTFTEPEDAQRALAEFDGSTLLGRKIRAETAQPRHRDVDDTLPAELNSVEARKAAAEEKRLKREQDRREAFKSPKLIIRNLPWSIKTPDDLANLFRSYGKVKSAVIPAAKKPGLMAGFGFVVLRGKKNAEKAISGVNGKDVDGRTLAVDYAVEKQFWEKQQLQSTQQQSTENAAVEGDDKSDVSNEDDVLLADDVDSEQDDDADEVQDSDADMGIDDADSGLGDQDDEESQRPKPDHSSTLFIRNLAYTTTDESLKEHFQSFGAVRYARVVLDQMTERPRGTGFVCFFEVADAQKCVRNAPSDVRQRGAMSSVLQSDSADQTGAYTLDGRLLNISWATDRTEAARLASGAKVSREQKDRRRLFLLSEGTISSRSPLYDTLSQTEIAMREASAKQRKQLIQSNPTLHLSLTRLSIRNLPRSVTSADLKKVAREAVVGFASDVQSGRRQKLSKEELMRGGPEMAEAERRRKSSGKGIVKQAKVVFEGRQGGKVSEETGSGRSRGYGFIEYYTHRSALMGLRWLNGHVIKYDVTEPAAANEKGKAGNREELAERKKRLIVEFAIENAAVVKRRNEREGRAKGKETGSKAGRSGRRSVEEPQPLLFDVPDEFSASGLSDRRSGARGATAAADPDDEEEDGQDEDGRVGKRRTKGKDGEAVSGKLAQRQRIIAKKRAARRANKRAGAGKGA